MVTYTANTIVNEEFKPILVYKSESPIVFKNKSVHVIKTDLPNAILQTVYTTEPYIYRQFTPAEDGNYYYWFIVIAAEEEEITTNVEAIEQLKTELSEYQEAYAIVTGSVTDE